MPGRAAPPRPVAVAGLRVRRALRALIDRALPPDAVIWFMSNGTGTTLMMGAVAQLGVADELGQGKASSSQLAARLNLDADALHRVLRALAVAGIVRLDRRGRFSLTRAGQALTSDHPQSMAPWVRYLSLGSTQAAWVGVAEMIRTGNTGFSTVHGMSVWDHFDAEPGEGRLFAETMRSLTAASMGEIAAGYPWPQDGVICDIAGGTGTLLAGLLGVRPGCSGVLVDVPAVLDDAAAVLAAAGLTDRVTLAPGDIFTSIEAVADVYVLKDILHDWDDERSLRILRAMRGVMAPGSRLVVIEQLQERDVPADLASLVDVQMLTQCEGGRQRSAAELHALMRAAGLAPGAVHRRSVVDFVEGVAV